MPEVLSNPQVNIAQSPAPAPAKGGRGFFGILIGVAALVITAVAIWTGFEALTYSGPAPSGSSSVVIGQPQTTPEIKNDSDFQQLEDQVNNTDLDSLTKDLDQNDTDAAGF